MKKSGNPGLLLMAAMMAPAFVYTSASTETPLLLPDITEFMASNQTTLKDANGNFPDWIEIHNPGTGAVNLANWSLTDNPGIPQKWVFPTQMIPPGGYVLVFASGDDRRDGAGYLHTNFKLEAAGEYLALFPPDGLIPVREFSPLFPPQNPDISWGTADGTGYVPYAEATPGSANGGVDSVAVPVTISPPGGTFSTSRTVTLSAALTNGSVIRYTLNGAAPTEASAIYNAPLEVTSNTRLRARVFKEELNPGPEAEAVFLRLGTGMGTFSSNLPVLLLDSDTAIAGSTSTTLTGTNAVFFDINPTTGRATLNDPANYTGRTGLRIRGRSSQSFPQKQYKLETWDTNGDDRDAELLGLPSGSDWVLSATYTDKSLIRNALAYQTWNEAGHPSLRGRFVEVFLNQNGTSQFTYTDDYAGIYYLVESINTERAGIQDPENTTDPAGITGGFITETGNADSQEFSTSGSGRPVAHSHRDPGRSQLNTAQRTWIRNRILEFEQALYASGFQHPVTGKHYREYTENSSQVDYRIMREWSRNFDGGSTNSYIPRGGKLTMGPLWDYNWAFGNINYAEGGDLPAYRTDGWNRSFTANVNGWAPWWLRMEQDPDWWQDFIDRWANLRRGMLSDTSMNGTIDSLTGPLAVEAAGRHFTKWPQLGAFTVISAPGWQTRTTYQSEIDYLKTWTAERSAWIDSRFPPTATVTPAGGVTVAGTLLQFSAASGGTVYFTTDGSDPRAAGGAVASGATDPAGNPVGVTQSVIINARTKSGALWGPPLTAAYVTGKLPTASGMRLSEISYHPPGPSAAELAADPTLTEEDFEFLEIRHSGTDALDLTGSVFTNGITFQIPAGIHLTPGNFLLVAKNPAALALRYPAAPAALGPWTGQLINSGETITLTGVDGAELFRARYADGWSPATDGSGYSLNLAPSSMLPDYNEATSWMPGQPTPGADGEAGFASEFALWQRSFFNGTERDNPPVSGPNADPDRDGATNLLEYALGSHPKQAESRPAVPLQRAGGAVSLHFIRPVRPLDLVYQLEFSTGLPSWTASDQPVTAGPAEPDGRMEAASITLPAAPSGMAFFRLRIVRP